MDKFKKIDTILQPIQTIFYLGFVFFWFKDNIASLREIKLSPLIFLIPFLALVATRWLMKLKSYRFRLPSLSKEKLLAIGLIVLLGFLLRLPYLLNYKGLLTSDEALFCLEGKHISEGKVPPITAYGQLYHGTLPSHLFALIFKIFGYSVFAFKFVTFLLYLGFIIFNFLFLTTIFPFNFSLIVSIFYCLPLGYLVHISLDDSFIFPFILLLGMSLIYLAYLIAYQKKEKYFSWLGFLIGLSFWTHQLTVYFIIVSLFIIIWSYRLALKKYFIIFLYAIIGFFPQLILEIFYRFHLIKFLTSGELIINWHKIKNTIFLISSLLTFSDHPSRIISFFIILLGFGAIFWYSLKAKQFIIAKIYNVYFIAFLIIYLLSGHSNRYLIRYLYPLFFCLPVLFLGPFLLIRKKIKYVLAIILCLAIFFLYNWPGQKSYYLAVKDFHNTLNKIVTFLEEKNIKYWKADFWTSYLLTALTGERVIVASTSFRRYYQYELSYYDYNEKENFIFLRGGRTNERQQAKILISLLESLGVAYKKEEIGDCWFIYEIESPIPYLEEPGPMALPQIEGPEIEISGGYLVLIYKNLNPSEENILFWLNVEIPSFSQVSRQFSLKDKEIKIRCPFPPKTSFSIIHYLDYWGTTIPSSYREKQLTLPSSIIENISRPEITYLYGFNFINDYEGKRMRACEKEVRIEINRKPFPGEKLCFVLHSPFNFSHLHWYGRLSQEVEIFINGFLISKGQLKDGRNEIKIGCEKVYWKERNNVVTLRFKHHFRFDFRPRLKTSAILERIFFE